MLGARDRFLPQFKRRKTKPRTHIIFAGNRIITREAVNKKPARRLRIESNAKRPVFRAMTGAGASYAAPAHGATERGAHDLSCAVIAVHRKELRRLVRRPASMIRSSARLRSRRLAAPVRPCVPWAADAARALDRRPYSAGNPMLTVLLCRVQPCSPARRSHRRAPVKAQEFGSDCLSEGKHLPPLRRLAVLCANCRDHKRLARFRGALLRLAKELATHENVSGHAFGTQGLPPRAP